LSNVVAYQTRQPGTNGDFAPVEGRSSHQMEVTTRYRESNGLRIRKKPDNMKGGKK
jgi:hypothetical protein